MLGLDDVAKHYDDVRTSAFLPNGGFISSSRRDSLQMLNARELGHSEIIVTFPFIPFPSLNTHPTFTFDPHRVSPRVRFSPDLATKTPHFSFISRFSLHLYHKTTAGTRKNES